MISRNDDVTIRVDHVSKYFRIYGDKSHTFKDRVLQRKRNQYELNKVLDDISFEVHRGEVLGLIGHNGCGKSTTLKLLNRILYPDKGHIEMKGRISSLIELGAGFHPDMTGRENIYINASIFGLKRKEIDERLDRIIRFSELEEFIDNPVRTYSSGMYMRLAFAIAINVEADILLIDEILAVGDASFQSKCFNKLQQIKQKGTTIVIVSHSMGQIQSICNRVLWLEQGVIREEGAPDSVCTDYMDAMEDKTTERHLKEVMEETHQAEMDPNREYPPVDVCPYCSKHARRSGNMMARYSNIELVKTPDSDIRRYGMDDTITIHGSILDNRDSQEQELLVLCRIVSKGGAHCCTMSNPIRLDKNRIDHGNEYRFSLAIEQTHLQKGIYYCDFMIQDTEQQVMYDCLNHFVQITIGDVNEQNMKDMGVVRMNAQWDVS